MNTNMKPEVSIVIPSYKNSPLDLENLHKNIANLDYPQVKVKVVNIKVSEGKKRIGYAEAANKGILRNKSDLILLINADTKLDKDLLKILVGYTRKNPEVGIVGPKVYSMSDPLEVSPVDLPVLSFNKFFGKMKKVDPLWLENKRKPFSVAWISGSCMLFRRRVWKKLSGFEKNYFMYWEDADFCMRTRNLGYKVFLVPNAKIWHRSGASIGKDNPERIYYVKRNSLYFLEKYTLPPGVILNGIKTTFLIFVKTLRYFLGEKEVSKAYIRAVFDYLRRKKG
ncbi:hypothetical protein A3A50_03375 [Candidatus Woesebacteria bacterium RIFCSPLOWO2_01_FULL_38_20]|nr:MAG: hypothetical protein A3A50_03375 [Candidatus Woesebacteria bacterium RIFCSPLOWO2_01_FULL_38_20]